MKIGVFIMQKKSGIDVWRFIFLYLSNHFRMRQRLKNRSGIWTVNFRSKMCPEQSKDYLTQKRKKRFFPKCNFPTFYHLKAIKCDWKHQIRSLLLSPLPNENAIRRNYLCQNHSKLLRKNKENKKSSWKKTVESLITRARTMKAIMSFHWTIS